jgi:hypothetical protein
MREAEMRTNDIVQGPRPTDLERTQEIYMPASRMHPLAVEEIETYDLYKGLCAKSSGNVNVCKTCPGGCRWGRELVRRLEEQPDQ